MVKPTAQQRLKEYKNEQFHVSDNILFCTICNKPVDHTKNSTITNHLGSNKHNKLKRKLNEKESPGPSKVSRQVSLKESFSVSDIRCDIAESWTRTLVSANIPLHKSDHPAVRQFLQDHVKGGGSIPHGSTLRRLYLPRCVDKDNLKVHQMVSGSVVALHVDETTDSQHRYVFSILCSVLSVNSADKQLNPPFLLRSVQLTSVNFQTISDAITGTVEDFGILARDVMAIVSDSASYMKKAWREILSRVYRNAHFISCYAHICSLAGQEWRLAFHDVDVLVSLMKSILIKAPARRGRYLRFISKFVDNPLLPPEPVVTRWNTWFNAVQYHSKHIDYYLGFAEEEMLTESKTQKLLSLKELLVKNSPHIKNHVQEIAAHSQKLVHLLDKLQSRQRQGHEVYNLVDDTITWLESLSVDDSVCEITKTAASTCASKLSEYHSGGSKQLAIHLFSFLRCLDPTQGFLTKLKKYEDIKDHLHFSDSCDNEWNIYLTILSEFQPQHNDNIMNFWNSISPRVPNLAKQAQLLLNIPVNSADVERAFRKLRDISTSNRQRLSFENMTNELKISVNYHSLNSVELL